MGKAKGIVEGGTVWVKDSLAGTDVFARARVVRIKDNGKVTVETSAGGKSQAWHTEAQTCDTTAPLSSHWAVH